MHFVTIAALQAAFKNAMLENSTQKHPSKRNCETISEGSA